MEVCEEVPRLLGALVAEVGDPLLAVGLGTQDLVGVLHAPARDPQRQLVWQEARVQRQVDAERQRLGRGEHQLHARARELRLLGQRPQHQLRLPARADLRLDPQRPAAVLDVPVHPAHHVPLQGRERRLAVALEHERPRLVQPIHLRLADAPTKSPAHQPLQLHPAHLADRQVVGQTRVGLVGAHPRALQLGDLHHASVPHRERAPDLPQPLAWMALGGTRDEGGHVALGFAQAHDHEHRGACRADLTEVLLVFSGVTSSRTDVGHALSVVFELARIPLQIPAPSHSQDLHVGLDRLQRAEQREEAGALAIL